MSRSATTGPATMVKILVNSGQHLILTLFMLILASSAFVLGYGGAAMFFGVVTLALAVVLYRKVQHERDRAKFGGYQIKW